MTAYSALVEQLCRDAPGVGPEPPGEGKLVVAEAGDLGSGAWVRLAARHDGSRWLAASWQAWGCPHTLAATALVASRLPGQPLAAPTVDLRGLASELGAPIEKLGRLLKVQQALQGLGLRPTIGSRARD